MGSTLGNVASGGLKVFTKGVAAAVSGVSAAASGVAALGTAAVSAYADYEQLVGGIETLFGAGGQSVEEYAKTVGKSVEEARIEYSHLMMAQEKALANADKAYETAGLSANEYMESVTSIAASLKQSTESEMDAVNAADQAIIDMADNANKMGTSMESIQNAYQGFAKQNYTMLDNLKLGYGGTKEEMQRLLEDATALSGVEYDISNLADVYSAIHVIQDELGITGTTADEASTTISGSVATMKGAWTNFVAGLANEDADFSTLADAVVDSFATVLDNLMPVAREILPSIVGMIEYLVPLVVEEAAGVLEEIMPDLVDTGVELLDTVITMLIDYLPTIINEGIPYLLEVGFSILESIMYGISENLPSLIEGALLIVEQLVTALIALLPMILEMGLEILVQLALGIAQALPVLIPQVVEVLLTLVETLLDNIDMLIDASLVLITALAEGLIDALPVLIEKAPTIIEKLLDAIVNNLPKLIETGLTLIIKMGEGLIKAIPQLVSKVPKIVGDLIDAFLDLASDFDQIGDSIITGIWDGITAGWDWLVGKVKGLANKLFGEATEEIEAENSGSSTSGGGKAKSYAGYSNQNTAASYSSMSQGVRASASVVQANTSYAAQQAAKEHYELTTNVYLEGEAKGVFKIVRQENDMFTKATGKSAFA